MPMSNVNVISVDALVIGTGAAGYNAAIRLHQQGVNCAIVTEGVKMGTSRNTGSDKQTYYKLGLGGDAADSVQQMARDLFAGGSMDGDTALCEAALSARSFLNLCELGVPFPVNRYGEYVGYKTDHDPRARATSAGPLTSKFMTEVLEQEATRRNIPVYDGLHAIEVLKDDSGVCGLLCLEMKSGNLTAFQTSNLIMATGGPAGMYADSVYPQCHTGSTSLAILAGAQLQNMTHWQFGLASVAPRWNVSGTYMQALPRFVSVDENGTEYEFLSDYFTDPYEALSCVFLKGYQWPFDSSKVMEGSSVIDLLVYCQCALLGRKVYLDFRTNPFGLDEIDFDRLSPEARDYLHGAGACFGTPLERLLHMNTPAYDLYHGKGVDLRTEMLEIALCAQHCNGGVAVDLWWQSSVPGLFAAGECAGTHGIARPGGSALNSGQVGSLRAAQYIATHPRPLCDQTTFVTVLEKAVTTHQGYITKVLSNPSNADQRIADIRRRMSVCGGAIREKQAMTQALEQTQSDLSGWADAIGICKADRLYKAYQYRDALVCQLLCLQAMLDYAAQNKGTQGSALYQAEDGQLRAGLEERFRFSPNPTACRDRIQQVGLNHDGTVTATWRPVRPLPAEGDVFETVWRRFREDRNVY